MALSDNIDALADRLADEFNAVRTVTPRIVVHGSTAGTSRPSYPGPVWWVGSVAPTNANTSTDYWLDTA